MAQIFLIKTLNKNSDLPRATKISISIFRIPPEKNIDQSATPQSNQSETRSQPKNPETASTTDSDGLSTPSQKGKADKAPNSENSGIPKRFKVPKYLWFATGTFNIFNQEGICHFRQSLKVNLQVRDPCTIAGFGTRTRNLTGPKIKKSRINQTVSEPSGA